MRIQITRRLSGSIDGIRLDGFVVGEQYLVGTNLGNYLLALGAAAPVADDGVPAKVMPLHDALVDEIRGWAAASSSAVAEASERPRRRKKPRHLIPAPADRSEQPSE